MAEIGKLVYKINGDTSDFDSSIKKSTANARKFGRSLKATSSGSGGGGIFSGFINKLAGGSGKLSGIFKGLIGGSGKLGVALKGAAIAGGPLGIALGAVLSGLVGIGKLIGKVVKGVAALSAAAAAAAAYGLAKFSIASIQVASDVEEIQNKFDVVFKSIGDEAATAAGRLAESFGLSSHAAKGMLADTADLLQGFGLAKESSLELSLNVQALAADLASFTNYSGGAKGAADALTKGLLGEREAMKSLGIAITEAELKRFAEEQGLVYKELDKTQKAILTYNLALRQSGNAIGDFARSSDSFANQMRVARSNVDDLKAQLGSALLPTVTSLVNAFNDELVPSISEAIQEFKDFAESDVGKEKISEFIDKIISGFFSVAATAEWVIYKIGQFADSPLLQKAIDKVGTLFGLTEIGALKQQKKDILSELYGQVGLTDEQVSDIYRRAYAVDDAITEVRERQDREAEDYAEAEKNRLIELDKTRTELAEKQGSLEFLPEDQHSAVLTRIDELQYKIRELSGTLRPEDFRRTGLEDQLLGLAGRTGGATGGDLRAGEVDLTKGGLSPEDLAREQIEAAKMAADEIGAYQFESYVNYLTRKEGLTELEQEYNDRIINHAIGSYEKFYMWNLENSKATEEERIAKLDEIFADHIQYKLDQESKLLDDIEALEDQKRKAKEEKEKAETLRKIDTFGALASQAVDIFGTIGSVVDNNAKQEIQNIEEQIKARKKAGKDTERLEENLAKKKAKIAYDAAVRSRALAIIDATINTAVGVTKAYYQGGALGFITGTLIAAAGAAQIAAISSQPLPPAAAEGMIVPGQSYAGDRQLVRVNSGEMILNQDQQQELFDIAKGEREEDDEPKTAVMTLDGEVLTRWIQDRIDTRAIVVPQGSLA